MRAARALRYSAPQIHHLLSGGKRISHRHTVPLCPWHHVGQPNAGLGTLNTEALLGPSMAERPRLFHARFGSPAELLEMTKNASKTAAGAEFRLVHLKLSPKSTELKRDPDHEKGLKKPL